MKILGMGLPEMMFAFMYVLVPVIGAVILYLVVKAAVKKAVVEAHDEIEARGKQG